MKKNFRPILLAIALILTSCEKNDEVTNNESSNFSKPKQLISNDFAKSLNDNYITERMSNIQLRDGSDDANAVWFSIEELENYIAYVKKEGEEKNLEIDGIRFYYGVYPNNYESSEKAGKTTIFLTPTKINQTTESRNSLDSSDATEISPMNFGGMGHPPKMEYGNQN
ncbi:hypothetical protein GOQ30_16850 [Flavobacterium sp. TP390]|uniref:Lipoprotein n=1 Tax=Flavobacterium profundi TaxID=1774945 RepID=A0A6I4IV81_9FLAO|nr:hypothetical protein [Flavobacterium profundi]MVO10842.1 hypothetical protein [Flavobacterium profundi]